MESPKKIHFLTTIGEAIEKEFSLPPSILEAMNEEEKNQLRKSVRTGKKIFIIRRVSPLADVQNFVEEQQSMLSPVDKLIAYLPISDEKSLPKITFLLLVSADKKIKRIKGVRLKIRQVKSTSRRKTSSK